MAERADPDDGARWPAGDEPTPDLEVGGPPEDPPEPLSLRRRVDPWVELVLLVALAFGIAWGIQAYVLKPFAIPSESMEATLRTGDRILAARFWYRFEDVERGDVIVFHPPLRPEDEEGVSPPDVADDVDERDTSVTFIKRVIGLPGEWIGSRRGVIWICRERPPRPRFPGADAGCRALEEPYLKGPQRPFRFREVPEGRYFVMGDNRDNSEDSRYLGTIERSWILGRAFSRYWPPQRIGLLGRDG